MAVKKKIVPEETKPRPDTQLGIFERAAKLFRAKQFTEARAVFLLATEGSVKEIAHNARLHIAMCDRRLQKQTLQPESIEDFYNIGVERLNARDLEGARRNLLRAIELSRSDGDAADHAYYAMAACQVLSGDPRGAYENLKRAIELEPRNRMAARQDPDFAGAANQPALQLLLHPDKSFPF